MNYKDYQEFNTEKSKCRKCAVGTYYNRVVCSVGNLVNPIYLICGEAPGETEVEKGQPFCGPAGKILREELIKNDLNKDNTVITNTIPCRPYKNQFPSDKNMVASCINMWLLNEITLLKPRFILLLGSTAVKYVLGSTRPITEIRGQVHQFLHITTPDNTDSFSDSYNLNIKTIVTFHPSYLLRNGESEFGLHLRELFNSDIKKFKNFIDNSDNPTF